MSMSVSSLVSESTLAGLHATRIQAGSFNQMRSEMAALRLEAARLNRDFRTIETQFNMLDDTSGESARRIAALERSIPLLVESLPLGSDIDYGLLTASFTEAGLDITEIEGGSIAISHRPLVSPDENIASPDQPMPPLAIERPADEPGERIAHAQGIALGKVVAPDNVQDEWNTILTQVGSLLLGTVPLMIDSGIEDETRLVAGPLPDLASAESLCVRISRAGIACDPLDYTGLPLP